MKAPEASEDTSLVRVQALGVAVDIEVVGARADDVVPVVAHAWSGAVRSGGVAARTLRIGTDAADASVELDSDEDDHLLHHLSQLVTQVAIEARAGELMMLHAAGLADLSTGRTVALVAPSGTGKTTLCHSLGHDYGYISDETVGFDLDLAVQPYRKPLSIVQPGAHLKHQVSPDEIGLGTAPHRAQLAGIVFLERDHSVAELKVSEVRTVAALPLLAEHTSYLSRHQRPLNFLADAVESTGGLRVARYDQVDQLRPLLDEILGGAG